MNDPWILMALSALAVMGAWFVKSEANPDAPPLTPPVERPPAEHEVKQALADLRASLERLQDVLERQHDKHEDELRAIQRQLDRIEGARRIEDVLAALARQPRET